MRDARDRMGRGMLQCIQDCRDCQDACIQTVQHCLRKGGTHAEARHIRTMADCAEICQTAANFMARESDQHARVCGLCSEICERCAASCEKMGGDEEMKACALSCRRCGQSCKEMAGAVGGAGT